MHGLIILSKVILETDNIQINDLYRSYLTIQLLALISQNQSFLRDFGLNEQESDQNMHKFSSGIIVAGGISEVMQEKDLFLALLDGLQLEGLIDLYVDSKRNYQLLWR
jgi:hypothetical protein